MQPAAPRSLLVSVCVAAERLARCWQILGACGERRAVALLGALCPVIAQTLLQSPCMHLVGLFFFPMLNSIFSLQQLPPDHESKDRDAGVSLLKLA